MASLWAEYIRERDQDIIEDELGFISFYVSAPKIMLEDFYVKKEARGKGHGLYLIKELEKLGKERGCNQLVATVVSSLPLATDTLRMCIRFGLKVIGSDNKYVWLSKEIT